MKADFRNRIFGINSLTGFREIALEIFNYQLDKNIVYHEFITNLGRNRKAVKTISDIPFLPVEFFRNKKIVTGDLPVEMIFESSGTAGVVPGKHFVNNLGLYEESFTKAFRMFYGDPGEYLIAALLPSYTERKGSSLVYMADKLIKQSNHPLSGFYKEDIESLIQTLKNAKDGNRKVLLLGVSFALIDLAEKFSPDLSGIIVMETGGMKGRRKELTRAELHSILKSKLNVPSIHSEYGMAELMSQAYSKGDGVFYCPPWMRVLIRDPHDPLSLISEPGRVGGINIIDLANINSCSFIATGDQGKLHEDGGFEVLGRFDNSDIRGCNLLVQ
ncbi:MAG: acyltransferase [Bacteroidales bacterium]|nr:acyltransferase [Bacteroidales bacterium]